ncbi:xanthine dehydrogenase family protein molybdopterin-binding subunit [Luteibacter flocculans]|uniref:Xanthine dehydrogenase family protein molybdopterin-binding subunit n=1 Tax=Luteibacter flocculans TaxID=2780091 RepID=A0ABY4T2M9_9GAMM|nr:molybdopterin cofactor-binding domain-containing protein [Luteibacter flocculans]URL59186.1 xanthine dehydrogenase family protein molybdopterin-binding subunit [Luteibacter flocculans]
MSGEVRLSRRRFLKYAAGTAGALVIGIGTADAVDRPPPLGLLGDAWAQVGPYLRIDADGRIFIGVRDPDNGEGTSTSLARIIAEELDADWTRVVVEPLGLGVTAGNGEPKFTYGRQRSGDATSIPAAWADLRQAGALGRWLLLQAAARRLGVPAEQLRGESGMAVAADGRRISYADLASAAASIDAPSAPPPLKSPDRYHLIGQPAGDVDARAVVTGALRYAFDETIGDPVIAVLARCPYPGGSLDTAERDAAMKVDGVYAVIDLTPEQGQPAGMAAQAPALVVLARDTWSALAGRTALDARWKAGSTVEPAASALEQKALELFDDDTATPITVRADGDITSARKKAARALEATYFQPWVAHATAETPNCVVRLDPDTSVTVIAATQSPRQVYTVVQRMTGFRPDQIDIQVPRGGGGFGRRLEQDYIAEAMAIALAKKPDEIRNRPVKVLWTRDDDLARDYYRPLAVHRLNASLDRRKAIVGWHQRMASPSALAGRGTPDNRLWQSELVADALPAGLVPNFRSDWYALDSTLARGEWRGSPHVTPTFASESFIDELAHAVKANPLDFRLALLGDPRQLPYGARGGPLDTGRLANVLRLAADKLDWSRWLRSENGLGIACAYVFGAYVAHAIEVSPTADGIDIHRVVCVADVGRVINPMGLEAQLQGATMDALSTALNLAITVKDGRVQQTGFRDYPIAATQPMPYEIETVIVPSTADPSGASVIAVPSAAPALANAVFRATAVRVRRLPLLRELARLR